LALERLLSLPQDMNDDMRVVFESQNRRSCADRALVLASLQIPHDIIEDASSCALIVPASFSAQAMEQLWLYDEENPPGKRSPKIAANYQNPVPGLIGYVIVICAFAWLAGTSTFGQDWLGAGRIDGVLIRNGEWWRTITALTLHSGLRHLVGNIIFGALFGMFAGRLLGSGIAWLAIVLAATTANVVNTLLLESAHRSIGASTAVFAALGIVAGFVWRGKLMSQERWLRQRNAVDSAARQVDTISLATFKRSDGAAHCRRRLDRGVSFLTLTLNAVVFASGERPGSQQ